MILIKWKISNKWTLIDSSRVNEVIRKISSLFIFFYEKILSAQKRKSSQNQLTKN